MTKPNINQLLEKARNDEHNSLIGENNVAYFRTVDVITLCEALIEAREALEFYTDSCFHPLQKEALDCLDNINAKIEFGDGK
jgi:hypothetical protein